MTTQTHFFSAADVRKDMAKALELLAAGDTVIITRYGTPLAVMKPFDSISVTTQDK